MYGFLDVRKLQQLAIVVLLALCFVFVFHSVIAHNHSHDLLPADSFGIIHDGLSQKFFLVIVSPFGFFIALPGVLRDNPRRRLALKYGAQSLAARAVQQYRLSFSRGLIHGNQH